MKLRSVYLRAVAAHFSKSNIPNAFFRNTFLWIHSSEAFFLNPLFRRNVWSKCILFWIHFLEVIYHPVIFYNTFLIAMILRHSTFHIAPSIFISLSYSPLGSVTMAGNNADKDYMTLPVPLVYAFLKNKTETSHNLPTFYRISYLIY